MNRKVCERKRSSHNLRNYPGIYPEGLKKIGNNLSQNSKFPGRDLKEGLQEYEAGSANSSNAPFDTGNTFWRRQISMPVHERFQNVTVLSILRLPIKWSEKQLTEHQAPRSFYCGNGERNVYRRNDKFMRRSYGTIGRWAKRWAARVRFPA
jgi:hypothetical protein